MPLGASLNGSFNGLEALFIFTKMVRKSSPCPNTATQTRTSGARPHEGEGYVAKMIEEQTAKLPSDVFLWAAVL